MRLALLSVTDKSGLPAFAKGLEELGYTCLSTGGTAKLLRSEGVEANEVSWLTGFPECMDGRVKTLHPKVHGGILGVRDNPKHAAEAEANGIEWIDIVVVNLYPFEKTVQDPDVAFETAIENIDIGGPAMVRSAAKNHEDVLVIVDPADYDRVLHALRTNTVTLELRRQLARKAFEHTARYDALISQWLATRIPTDSQAREKTIPLTLVQQTRYGENPHQHGVFYADSRTERSLARGVLHQGKEMSYNNWADLDAAVRAAFDIDNDLPVCAIIKHMNPCGLATGPSIEVAYERALAGDPVSAFGGILAFNRRLTATHVMAIRQSKIMYEVLAAPGFDPDALEALKARENLRVLELPDDWARSQPTGMDGRRVQGGWLLQDWDINAPCEWRVVTKRQPTNEEARGLRFAWAAVRNVKSNGIVLARSLDDGATLNGVGAGQMSRVDSVRLAIAKATLEVRGSVLGSDAFFPFPDGPEAAGEEGIMAIIQPGGSKKDDEVIAVADHYGMAMVFTGTRHFRH